MTTSIRDIMALAKRAEDQEGVRGAHRACYLIVEHKLDRDQVLEALHQIGDGPRGEPDAVEAQVDVDEFVHIHTFSDWLEFADGSILSPDGDHCHADDDIAEAAAAERQANADAAAEAVGDALRESRGWDS